MANKRIPLGANVSRQVGLTQRIIKRFNDEGCPAVLKDGADLAELVLAMHEEMDRLFSLPDDYFTPEEDD